MNQRKAELRCTAMHLGIIYLAEIKETSLCVYEFLPSSRRDEKKLDIEMHRRGNEKI